MVWLDSCLFPNPDAPALLSLRSANLPSHYEDIACLRYRMISILACEQQGKGALDVDKDSCYISPTTTMRKTEPIKPALEKIC